ncbi:MAG: hypothetical protein RMK80_02170 [Pseudobdellovibrionaceae bacterium]|nr:hypothetical protein [Pseudobdellovibrionaceae bacterium]
MPLCYCVLLWDTANGLLPRGQDLLLKRWQYSHEGSVRLDWQFLVEDAQGSFSFKETWWILNFNQIKIQTNLVEKNWLKWEILYKTNSKIGPIPNMIDKVSEYHLLFQRIFFWPNNLPFLPVKSDVVLSRQAGRVTYRLEAIQDLFLWFDTENLSIVRIKWGDLCDVRYSSPSNAKQLPSHQTVHFENQKAVGHLVQNLVITKFDPRFFLEHSGEFIENPVTEDDQLVLKKLKRFYQLCR